MHSQGKQATMDNDTTFIDTVSWTAAGGLILAWIITSNWMYCYYRLRHSEQIIKRRPRVVLIVAFVIFIDMMIKPWFLLSANGQLPTLWLPGNVWIYISACLSTVLSMYLMVYRGYMTYFEIKWNLAMDNSQWRLSIDPEETNWFLANKKQWGDSSKPLFILMAIYIPLTAVSLYCSVNQHLFQYARYLVVVNIILVNVFGTILFCKFPRFDDIWKIGKEIKIILPSCSIPTLIYLVINVMIKVEYPDPIGIISIYISAVLDIALAYSSMGWVLRKNRLPTNLVTLHWYIHKQPELEKGMHFSMSISDSAEHRENRKKSEARRKKMNEILQDPNGFNAFARHLSRSFSVECILFFLETTQWIHSVSDVMKREKTEIKLDDDDARFRFNVLLSIRFPDSAPKSSFIDFETSSDQSSHSKDQGSTLKEPSHTKRVSSVMSHVIPVHLDGPIVPHMVNSSSSISTHSHSCHSSNISNDVSTTITVSDPEDSVSPRMSNTKVENCYWSAVKLFEKYVTNDAYFSVNISWEDRQRLYELVGYSDAAKYYTTEQMMQDSLMRHCEFDLKQLIHIFDASRYAVYKLMDQCYYQFSKTDEYKKYFEEK